MYLCRDGAYAPRKILAPLDSLRLSRPGRAATTRAKVFIAKKQLSLAISDGKLYMSCVKSLHVYILRALSVLSTTRTYVPDVTRDLHVTCLGLLCSIIPGIMPAYSARPKEVAVGVLVFLLLTETGMLLAWKASRAYLAPLYEGEGWCWPTYCARIILKVLLFLV